MAPETLAADEGQGISLGAAGASGIRATEKRAFALSGVVGGEKDADRPKLTPMLRLGVEEES